MAKLTKSLQRPTVGRAPTIGKGSLLRRRPSPVMSRSKASRKALYPKTQAGRT